MYPGRISCSLLILNSEIFPSDFLNTAFRRWHFWTGAIFCYYKQWIWRANRRRATPWRKKSSCYQWKCHHIHSSCCQSPFELSGIATFCPWFIQIVVRTLILITKIVILRYGSKVLISWEDFSSLYKKNGSICLMSMNSRYHWFTEFEYIDSRSPYFQQSNMVCIKSLLLFHLLATFLSLHINSFPSARWILNLTSLDGNSHLLGLVEHCHNTHTHKYVTFMLVLTLLLWKKN